MRGKRRRAPEESSSASTIPPVATHLSAPPPKHLSEIKSALQKAAALAAADGLVLQATVHDESYSPRLLVAGLATDSSAWPALTVPPEKALHQQQNALFGKREGQGGQAHGSHHSHTIFP